MRISCDTSDPGYALYFPMHADYRVLLNGSTVSEVITADEDRGELIRLARDEYGNFILNDARDELVTELVPGRVEIVMAPRGVAA